MYIQINKIELINIQVKNFFRLFSKHVLDGLRFGKIGIEFIDFLAYILSGSL